ELVAQPLLGGVDHDPVVDVEHQVGNLHEPPQPPALHARGVELVDLAVVEEGDLVERLGHGNAYRTRTGRTGGGAAAVQGRASRSRTRSRTGSRPRARPRPPRRRPGRCRRTRSAARPRPRSAARPARARTPGTAPAAPPPPAGRAGTAPGRPRSPPRPRRWRR